MRLARVPTTIPTVVTKFTQFFANRISWEQLFPLEELEPPAGPLPDFPLWWITEEASNVIMGLYDFHPNLAPLVRSHHLF